MKKIFLGSIIIVIQGLLYNCFAQTVIEGRIINKLNQPVPDASVMLLKSADSTVVAFTFSNSYGDYTIYTDQKEDVLLIKVHGFNIQRQFKKIDNQSQKVDFIVSEEAILLNEFSVKSEKIWGTRDTINFVVDAFRDSTDLVIGDVLKKMPGIVVRESGQIEYRGKPISRFYIENMDMLQGRYGIATKNINAADVATVQVFENHQPIRALQDIAFSDDAAINLKLKQGAKGTYAGTAVLDGGTDKQFLWNSSVTGMHFGQTRQHLTSFKTNNTGKDLGDEFQSFNHENIQPIGSFSSILIPSPPQINRSRYYFNRAFGGTINNLIKTNDETELTFNLSGFRDNDDRRSYTQTSFIIPGEDTLTISERMDSQSNLFKLEGGIGYKKNSDTDYLNTRLLFSGSFVERTGNIFNNESIIQNDKHRPLSAAGIIHWIQRGNNKQSLGTELNSQSFYQSQPYRLDITPGMFANELNDSLPFNAIRQNVAFNSFETRNNLMLLSSRVWRSIRIHPIVNFSLKHQSLNTHLSRSHQGEAFSMLTDDSLQNELAWMRARAGISMNLTYRKRDLDFKLATPIQFEHVSLSDRIQLNDSQHNRLVFQPQASFRYNINTRWDVSGSWFWYNHNPNLRSLYSGYIMQNYRTLSRYESRLFDSYGQQGNLRLSYTDIMQFLFAGIEISYNRYRNEVMYAQEFEGSRMKISLVEMESKGDYLSFTARAGKGFDWKKLSVNAEASWGKGITPQLRQNSLIVYKHQGINANMTFSMAVTEKLQFANKCSWSRVSGSADAGHKLDPIVSFINAAKINYILPNNLIFSIGMEYYDTRFESRNQIFYLLDAGITYTWRRIRFTLDYNNILNTTDYITAYYSNLNTYYSEYRIRPASILLSARFKLF